jgi:uncharacterized protein (DUF1800 family)
MLAGGGASQPDVFRKVPMLDRTTALHLANRMGFGPAPGELERIQSLGFDGYVNEQLNPRIGELPPSLEAQLKKLPSFGKNTFQLYRDYYWKMLDDEKMDKSMRGLMKFAMKSVVPEWRLARMARAIASPHRLHEALVDFWFNHFNVFLNKGADRYTVPAYERDAIRPYVFGKFHDLLLATAKSPAMLFYLDNWQSVAPERMKPSAGANSKPKRGLNENYGRELLELHTLGVDGGYTQRDVVEVARCFTGWGISPPRKGGIFEYNDKVHDKGEKVVLGHVIPAGGNMSDGLTVIDILSQHPGTARFISTQMARRFVADDPPPSLIAHMTKTFLKTRGDLREVFRTMLSSPEFFSQGAYNAKVKSPFEMVVSALRATNADVTSGYALANELTKLGEPLYRKLEPTGYSTANAEWVNSGALLERMNFALALTHNRISGATVDVPKWDVAARNDPVDFSRSLLEQDPSPQTRAALEKIQTDTQVRAQLASATEPPEAPQISSLVAGVTLGSPEFQRR